jgi:OOP family OmpA-OmpF porin
MRHLRLLSVVQMVSTSMVGLALATGVSAQSVKVEGFITARDGSTMILKTSDSPKLLVLLTDSTEVGQVQGILKARRKEMSMAALIPGLAVKVEGAYDDQNQLVANSVSFKGNDLQQAQSIQAGMHETKAQAQQNKAELEKHKAELEKHNAALEQHQQQISANKAGIDAAIARFGQLDDYYILDEVSVHFANGKVKVDPKYVPQLLALATKAKTVNGYMIEVKGYASSTGSVALNQRLSEDRAGGVTNILIQQAQIPLTRMLAPGAMGESEQVSANDTEEGQAANRRVVVRVLQNKAIAGI